MRNGFLGSLGVLFTGAGLALAQQAPAFRPAQWVPYQPARAMPVQWAPPAYPQQTYPGYPPPMQQGYYPAPMQGYYPQAPQGYPIQAPQGYLPAYQQPGVNMVGPLATPPVTSPPMQTSQPQLPSAVNAPVLSLPSDQPETVPAPKEKKTEPSSPAVVAVPEGVCEGPGWYAPEYPGVCEDCDEGERSKEGHEKPMRFWTNLEYLYWRIEDAPLNAPLLATGTAGGSPTTPINVLDTEYDGLHGGRATVGFWLAPRLGVEASGFYLPEQGDDVQITGGGAAILGRPVLDAATGLPSALVISSPGLASGTFDAELLSTLWSTEAHTVIGIVRGDRVAINLLFGGRYTRFDEELTVGSTTNVLAGGLASFAGTPLAAGSAVRVEDRFETRNKFYGGQFGIQGGIQRGRLFVGLTAKIAVGVTDQELDIQGSSRVLGTPTVVPAGLLAVASNSGVLSDTAFTLLPEGTLEVGYQLTKCVSLTMGYNYLYWTRVSRPGDHVSAAVSGTQVPVSGMFGAAGPAVPTVTLQDADFWVRGITAGIAIRY